MANDASNDSHGPHLIALGKVVSNFSALETAVLLAVTALIGPDQNIGKVVGVQLSFKRKLDLLMALVRYQFGEDIVGEADAAVRLASKAEEMRNLVIHSVFAADAEGELLTTRLKFSLSRKKGLVETNEPTSPEEVGKTVTATYEALIAVIALLDHLSDASAEMRRRIEDQQGT